MGLDVYLKWFDDHDDTQRRESEFEARTKGLWRDGMTQADKDGAVATQAVVANELGLDTWGADETRVKTIERPSEKHPDHYFKVGYFRSSYNDGGINRVLSQMIGEDLYSICGHKDEDEYHFQPDWQMTRVRAMESINKLDAFLAENGGAYGAMAPSLFHVRDSRRSPVTDDASALAAFVAERKSWAARKQERDDSFDGYSNLQGEFYFGGPLKVVGIIPGTDSSILGRGQATAYLIYERDVSWYRQALEIVVETCDWVLAQPDADKYRLAWSS